MCNTPEILYLYTALCSHDEILYCDTFKFTKLLFKPSVKVKFSVLIIASNLLKISSEARYSV